MIRYRSYLIFKLNSVLGLFFIFYNSWFNDFLFLYNYSQCILNKAVFRKKIWLRFFFNSFFSFYFLLKQFVRFSMLTLNSIYFYFFFPFFNSFNSFNLTFFNFYYIFNFNYTFLIYLYLYNINFWCFFYKKPFFLIISPLFQIFYLNFFLFFKFNLNTYIYCLYTYFFQFYIFFKNIKNINFFYNNSTTNLIILQNNINFTLIDSNTFILNLNFYLLLYKHFIHLFILFV